MKKEDALAVITKVKLKPTIVEAFEALVEVENAVKQMNEFSYSALINFIGHKMPTKMGGVYITIAQALSYLKNELKKQNKLK